jgi:hypothetical protein
LLKTQDLAFFGAKNKLVFECRKGQSKAKKDPRIDVLCTIILEFDTQRQGSSDMPNPALKPGAWGGW